jgi:cytosine/adenosine deaminase-related metal-dependent hydrolase
LIPGLVNAHTPLNLTHIGPQEYDPVGEKFGDWLRMILRERATSDAAIRASVRFGIERSLAGGVVTVGDIAGVWSTVPTETMREAAMTGVSFIECFGIGARQEESFVRMMNILDSLERVDRGVRVGVSPHAPYTVGHELYKRLLAHGIQTDIPLATHLAESDPEHEFIASGGGLFRDLLESMGLWDESILVGVGPDQTPIDSFFAEHRHDLMRATSSAPVLLVHCNDVSDPELDLLAGAPVSIAYCPRSSAYFGAHHRFGAHRYAQMCDRGINVALGTDSIVNLPMDADGKTPMISTLDEIRFLYERDGDSGGRVSPRSLLAMATTNAALALGLDMSRFTLAPGAVAGVVSAAIEDGVAAGGLAKALAHSTSAPKLLAGPGS